MPDVNWFPHTSQQIIDALGMGGFASFIPCMIEPVWDGVRAPLAGMPISICFTGLRLDEHLEPSYVVSCYWFDPQTYSENEGYREMTYRPRHQSQYQVIIFYSKRDRSWEGWKMRGSSDFVVTAKDSDFTRFVIQLTMLGLDDGEHVEPMLTGTQTASTGLWVSEAQAIQQPKLVSLEILSKPGDDNAPLAEQEFYKLCIEESDDVSSPGFIMKWTHGQWSEVDGQVMWYGSEWETLPTLKKAKEVCEEWRKAFVAEGFAQSDSLYL